MLKLYDITTSRLRVPFFAHTVFKEVPEVDENTTEIESI